jgi:tRNA-2-methylthio-N6-dimethylallyladenosine synthase
MALPTLSPSARGFRVLPLAERPVSQRIVPPLGRPPRIHLWHIGCQMNDADRGELAQRFAEIGCIPETPLDDADIAVLITCTVRASAEQKVYGKFRELIPWKRARHGRAIALTGCMAVEHGAPLLERMPDLDYVFDVRDPDGFLAKVQALHSGDLDQPLLLPAPDRLSGYVPVMGGCNEMCTYCIVPFVRGRELSRPVTEVVAHVQRLVDSGLREITLLGQNVNSYQDPRTGARLPQLMAAVDGIDGLQRLRFLTSHPRNAVPQLFEAMRDLHTVCEQLHLPVQAGSDAMLRRMRRLYSVDDYRQKIRVARETVGRRMSLSTDIIVGFCGETDEEFAATEALMREIGFDTVHLAAYSPRPGTAAARRADDIPQEEKKRRLNHLLDVQRSIAAGINAAYVGTHVEVLVEGEADDGRLYGRTRENKVAWLPPDAAGAGELCTASVIAASSWQLHAQPFTPAA